MDDEDKKEAIKLLDELIENLGEKIRLSKELNEKIMNEPLLLGKLKMILEK